MTDEKRIIYPETPKCDIEFYMPDIKIKECKLSTKESFIVIADQALKSNADGILFAISSDSKGFISLIFEEKIMNILNISSGVFDRYWEFLNICINSPGGLKLKTKGKDQIYSLASEFGSTDSGRSIYLRFSKSVTEKELLGIKDEDPETSETK